MQHPSLLDKKLPVVVRMPFILFPRHFPGQTTQRRQLKLARQIPNFFCSYRDSNTLNVIILGGNRLDVTNVALNFDDQCLVLEAEGTIFQSRGNHALLTEFKNDGWVIVEEDHRPTENQLELETAHLPVKSPDKNDHWNSITVDLDEQEELREKAAQDDEEAGANISPVVEPSEIIYEEITNNENNGANNGEPEEKTETPEKTPEDENSDLVEKTDQQFAQIEETATEALAAIKAETQEEQQKNLQETGTGSEKQLETVEADNGGEENETNSISDNGAGKGANRSRRRPK